MKSISRKKVLKKVPIVKPFLERSESNFFKYLLDKFSWCWLTSFVKILWWWKAWKLFRILGGKWRSVQHYWRSFDLAWSTNHGRDWRRGWRVARRGNLRGVGTSNTHDSAQRWRRRYNSSSNSKICSSSGKIHLSFLLSNIGFWAEGNEDFFHISIQYENAVIRKSFIKCEKNKRWMGIWTLLPSYKVRKQKKTRLKVLKYGKIGQNWKFD